MLFRRLQLFEIAHLAGNFSARARGCCRQRERNAFLGETPRGTHSGTKYCADQLQLRRAALQIQSAKLHERQPASQPARLPPSGDGSLIFRNTMLERLGNACFSAPASAFRVPDPDVNINHAENSEPLFLIPPTFCVKIITLGHFFTIYVNVAH